jgi:hypothetical protein
MPALFLKPKKDMRKFKVIALSVGGLGNKIFNAGETVLENNFEEGHADILVRKGFLSEDGKAVKETKKSKAELKAEKEAAEKEAAEAKLLAELEAAEAVEAAKAAEVAEEKATEAAKAIETNDDDLPI